MKEGAFYEDLAFYYDFICSDRKRDVNVLLALIEAHKRSPGNTLLDVACGTGLEDLYLKKYFTVAGVDVHQGVLDIARKRNPEITYKRGDMRTFKFDEDFDVICCFDAMMYLQTVEDLKKTFKNFYSHLRKGGVLVFYVDHLRENCQNTQQCTAKEKDDLHVILFEDFYGEEDRGESYLIFVVRKEGRSEVFVDKHTLTIFRLAEVEDAAREAGFTLHLYNMDEEVTFSTAPYTEGSPVFVCAK